MTLLPLDVEPATSRYPLSIAERDRELSTLYDRLLSAQSAAEIAGQDDIAAHLRALRAVVHTRLVFLAWGRR